MDHDFNQIEDFIADERFQSFVLKEEEKNIAYWDQWLLANPDKKELVEKATHFLLGLQLQESPLANNQLVDAETILRNAIQVKKEKKSKKIINISVLMKMVNWIFIFASLVYPTLLSGKIYCLLIMVI